MTNKYKNNIPPDLHEILYDELLENPFMGINITDGNGRVLYLNGAHFRITNQSPEKYIGNTMKSLVQDKTVSQSATVEALNTKKPVLLNQVVSNGNSFQVKAIPFFGENGSIKYVLNYLIDVSELVEVKELVNKIQADKLKIEDQYELLKKTLVSNGNLIYQSKSMQSVVDLAKKIAQSDVTVLITGPSGSGKEHIANLVHQESKRTNMPFIKINCAAIPEQLLESELFGYEPGAFTGGNPKGKAGLFECADGGSLLLDEIGEMPLSLQAKLLRVLQDQEVRRLGQTKPIKVNVRIIASTNASLKEMIAERKFREDLYYRLNIIEINIPGLSDRKEDIPLLIEHFINVFNTKYDYHKTIQFEAVKYLSSRDYPGNVRELRNIIERLIIQSATDKITVKDAYEAFGLFKTPPADIGSELDIDSLRGSSLKEIMAQYEKKVLTEYLKIYGSRAVVAEKLKTDQSTLSRKLSRYKI